MTGSSDYWMREQDIRRSLHRPGGWESPGALVTLATFSCRVAVRRGQAGQARAGVERLFALTGPTGTDETVVRMDKDGRARAAESVATPDGGEPTVRLRMPIGDFVLACGGRRPVETLTVEVEGDTAPGQRVLGVMAVTP